MSLFNLNPLVVELRHQVVNLNDSGILNIKNCSLIPRDSRFGRDVIFNAEDYLRHCGLISMQRKKLLMSKDVRIDHSTYRFQLFHDDAYVGLNVCTIGYKESLGDVVSNHDWDALAYQFCNRAWVQSLHSFIYECIFTHGNLMDDIVRGKFVPKSRLFNISYIMRQMTELPKDIRLLPYMHSISVSGDEKFIPDYTRVARTAFSAKLLHPDVRPDYESLYVLGTDWIELGRELITPDIDMLIPLSELMSWDIEDIKQFGRSTIPVLDVEEVEVLNFLVKLYYEYANS